VTVKQGKKVGEENNEGVNIHANLKISINFFSKISDLCMVRESDGKHGDILANYY
jgi:hypothetical protein